MGCQAWWQAPLSAEPSYLPSLSIQWRRFIFTFTSVCQDKSQQGTRHSALTGKLVPSWERALSPGLARAESTFPMESPPQPEAAYTALPWPAGPRAQGREAKRLGRALPVHQCHAALTRQCALNSCSWLFRFSFMATRALRLWRMLRRKGQGHRAGHYRLLLQTENKATTRLQGAPS